MDTIVSLSPPVLRLPLAITITTTTSRHLLPPAAASSSGSSLRLLIKQRSSSSIIGNHSPPARQRSVLLSSRASASSSVSTATVAVASAQKEKEKDLVFVAGATGRVGSRAVRELIKLGFRVRAAVRNTQRATSLVQSVQQLKQDAAAELELVECDLEKQAQEGIVSAIGNASLVVCSIGASEKEILDVTGPYRIDYMATNKLVQAASAAKVEHFILVTSLGTNKIGFPAFLLNLFWGVLYWKRRAEEALIASGIPYTIIRPGGMERPTDAFKETHNLVLAPEDTYVGGQVSNLQVAELIGCINSNRRAACCKIVEVVAETTAPLLPMEQLLSAIPSNREPPPPPPAADADDEPPMVDPDPDLEPAHDGDGDGAQDVVAPESRPRRIALFVEPSPFAYVSGYKNRFQNFIKYLREMGDEVIVVTTHGGVPQEFHGAKLIGSWSFPCPWYQKVPLSLALSPRIIGEIARFKPDIIHASSPGIMVFGALIIAKLLCVPLVMSYHTHVPIYIPRYTFSWLVKPMWLIIKFLHRAADLTLVPSIAIGRDLEAARVTAANKIRLWNKGVDSESFHPRFRNMQMRSRLTNGEPEKPLIFYVGRLGVEKSLDFLKRVMDRLPGARIAFIGDGPFRAELEQMFSGMPAVFTGTLQGQELSQAYASGDVFVMPSESETLGFVVLEAMSSGVPVVGARAGGIPDIIPEDQEGKTSFLYTPGDVDDCVGKIEQLLSSEELREAMGRAARKEMEKFDWQAATRKIRNEQYSAAIWFWRKKRALLLRPLRWVLRLLRPRMPGAANADAVAKQS